MNNKITYLDEEFKPLPKDQRTSAKYVKKERIKDVTVFRTRQYDFVKLTENEIGWLKRLSQFSWVPKIVKEEDHYIILTYVGEPVTIHTLPLDWKEQMEIILTDMNSASCFHNDIKNAELLVKDNKLHLIDYHHATSTREEFLEKKKTGECGCRIRWEDRAGMINILGKMEKAKCLENQSIIAKA